MLAAAGPAQADEFFLVRDENPLIRSFYLPLPSDSRLADGVNLAATLAISNTLNVESRTGENLFVDGESDALRLTFENSLYQSWRYRITLPIIHDSGGFLDSAIDHYHRWFGFNPGFRPDYPHGQIIYAYSGKGEIELTHSGTSIGDISGELGWFAIDGADSRRLPVPWRNSPATAHGTARSGLITHCAGRPGNWLRSLELPSRSAMSCLQATRIAHLCSDDLPRRVRWDRDGRCARNSTVKLAGSKTAPHDFWAPVCN
jgi:hypothetical protein